MKGPGYRNDLDVRRVWKCPKCEKAFPALGTITAKQCRCVKEGIWMQLAEERRPKSQYPVLIAEDTQTAE